MAKNSTKFCMNIPGLVPWISSDKAHVHNRSFWYWRNPCRLAGFTYSQRNSAQAAELLCCWRRGGAHQSFVPGRGCNAGTLHARLLSEVLSDESDHGSVLAFRRKTERGNQTDI